MTVESDIREFALEELNKKLRKGDPVSSHELEGFTLLVGPNVRSKAIVSKKAQLMRWNPYLHRPKDAPVSLISRGRLSHAISCATKEELPPAPSINCKWAYVLVDAIKINDYIACLEDMWPNRFLDPNKGDVAKATRAFKLAFYGYMLQQVGARIWTALVAMGLFAAIKKWFT